MTTSSERRMGAGVEPRPSSRIAIAAHHRDLADWTSHGLPDGRKIRWRNSQGQYHAWMARLRSEQPPWGGVLVPVDALETRANTQQVERLDRVLAMRVG